MSWQLYPILTKEDIRDAKKDRKKARFLVDENVGMALLEALKSAGFNALNTRDLGISGHPDESVLAVAKREDRVLLTQDNDFLDNRKHPLSHNPGIVVLPSTQGNAASLVSALRDVMRIVGVSRELWRESRIVITQDGVWTVSTLDRSTGRIVTNRYRFTTQGMEYWEE